MDDTPVPIPNHDSQARIWLVTNAQCPIGLAVCRDALSQGDRVVACVRNESVVDVDSCQPGWGDQVDAFDDFRHEIDANLDWSGRWKEFSRTDTSNLSQCHSILAEAVHCWGQIDILFCCDSEVLIGTVEELLSTPQSRGSVRNQFEVNFFGPVNFIKSALPYMREKNKGHVVVLTSIVDQIGSPGLAATCAASHAVVGFCESLAFEVAPFGIKISIVETAVEVLCLTNRITWTAALPAYQSDNHPTPLFRDTLESLLPRVQRRSPDAQAAQRARNEDLQSFYVALCHEFAHNLVQDVVCAVLMVANRRDPPSHYIVGSDAAADIKDRLKLVGGELEGFAAMSLAVDVGK